MGKERQGHRGAEGPVTGKTPQGPTGTWVQAEGGKGGCKPAQEMAADTGTQSEAQGRAAEADGWQVRATSRWVAFCTCRGGGEWV